MVATRWPLAFLIMKSWLLEGIALPQIYLLAISNEGREITKKG